MSDFLLAFVIWGLLAVSAFVWLWRAMDEPVNDAERALKRLSRRRGD